jgi:hypothetical protein
MLWQSLDNTRTSNSALFKAIPGQRTSLWSQKHTVTRPRKCLSSCAPWWPARHHLAARRSWDKWKDLWRAACARWCQSIPTQEMQTCVCIYKYICTYYMTIVLKVWSTKWITIRRRVICVIKRWCRKELVVGSVISSGEISHTTSKDIHLE